MFMACFLLLFLECWMLARLGGDRRALRALFTLDLPPPRPKGVPTQPRVLGGPALAVMLVLVAALYPARAIPQRVELRPARAAFGEFPVQIGDWRGRRRHLEPQILDTLKLDDYVFADYIKTETTDSSAVPVAAINLYAAYYASQRTGQSAPSPRSCLPGGGWRIEEFGEHAVPGANLQGAALRVNRAVIRQGSTRQLVYYWFQERGRDLTNEYLVKWYLFTDSLLRNRTDGALVRLVTPLLQNEDSAEADARLSQFTLAMLPQIGKYLPN